MNPRIATRVVSIRDTSGSPPVGGSVAAAIDSLCNIKRDPQTHIGGRGRANVRHGCAFNQGAIPMPEPEQVVDAILEAIEANAKASTQHAFGEGVTPQASDAAQFAGAVKDLCEGLNHLGVSINVSALD